MFSGKKILHIQNTVSYTEPFMHQEQNIQFIPLFNSSQFISLNMTEMENMRATKQRLVKFTKFQAADGIHSGLL